MRYLFSIVVLILACFSLRAEKIHVYFLNEAHQIVDSTLLEQDMNSVESDVKKNRPSPLLQLFKRKQRTNKKITAAILAFPFPFGIVGLHRIYLGTAPYVPVVYIASLGGVFGILPFIDFCVIALDKDIERYKENKKVFMWVKD